MTVRKWLAAAALAAGTALGAGGPTAAAEPAKPVYGFGTLRAATAAEAKAKAEAWLKAAGKFDQSRFDVVWADESRPVLDRTVDSILLGLPEAAPVLAAARQPDAPAPTEVPAVIRDAKDPFVKANLAAAYAKALVGRKVYEEALDAIKAVQPEQAVDPAGFYFHKAVAEHALIQRSEAINSLARLLDDVPDAPDRYRVVATLMFFDLQNWAKDEKDLSNITRLMDNSGRRLELARGGPKTQDIQKKIVFRLDEKIKELEAQAKQRNQQCNGGQCPNGGQPGNGGGNPSGPMADSNIATNGGQGTIDEKKLRSYEENWGKLPEEARKQIMQEVVRDLPAKFKPMIEDYFRALNRMHGYKNP